MEELLSRPDHFEFTGSLLFKNELRPETKGVIRDLQLADIRTIMITGDSVYTGVAIAEQCGLVDQCPYVIFADPDSGTGLPVWAELDDASWSFDLIQLFYLVRDRNRGAGENVVVTIGVTAAAYNAMTTGEHAGKYKTVWARLRPYVRVYGRFKPDGKTRVIRDYQLEGEDMVVAMCGDGGNDSGALKQAHVGVALAHGGQTGSSGGVGGQTGDEITHTITPVHAPPSNVHTYCRRIFGFMMIWQQVDCGAVHRWVWGAGKIALSRRICPKSGVR